jgi:hypothetical protein
VKSSPAPEDAARGAEKTRRWSQFPVGYAINYSLACVDLKISPNIALISTPHLRTDLMQELLYHTLGHPIEWQVLIDSSSVAELSQAHPYWEARVQIFDASEVVSEAHSLMVARQAEVATENRVDKDCTWRKLDMAPVLAVVDAETISGDTLPLVDHLARNASSVGIHLLLLTDDMKFGGAYPGWFGTFLFCGVTPANVGDRKWWVIPLSDEFLSRPLGDYVMVCQGSQRPVIAQPGVWDETTGELRPHPKRRRSPDRAPVAPVKKARRHLWSGRG